MLNGKRLFVYTLLWPIVGGLPLHFLVGGIVVAAPAGQFPLDELLIGVVGILLACLCLVSAGQYIVNLLIRLVRGNG